MSCGTCYASDHDATAVLTCLACPHARATGFVSCSLNRRPIVRQVCGGRLIADAGQSLPEADGRMTGGCPLNGVDQDGRIRWMGILWRGVPWPRRVLMADEVWCGFRYGLPRPAAPDDFPGCGCVDALKAWWERTRHGWAMLIPARLKLIAAITVSAVAFYWLAGCTSSVSAHGADSSVERTSDIAPGTTETVTIEKFGVLSPEEAVALQPIWAGGKEVKK